MFPTEDCAVQLQIAVTHIKTMENYVISRDKAHTKKIHTASKMTIKLDTHFWRCEQKVNFTSTLKCLKLVITGMEAWQILVWLNVWELSERDEAGLLLQRNGVVTVMMLSVSPPSPRIQTHNAHAQSSQTVSVLFRENGLLPRKKEGQCVLEDRGGWKFVRMRGLTVLLLKKLHDDTPASGKWMGGSYVLLVYICNKQYMYMKSSYLIKLQLRKTKQPRYKLMK